MKLHKPVNIAWLFCFLSFFLMVWQGKAMAFDGDTWNWDGSTWTQVSSTGPTPRSFAAMGYDQATGQLVLFGGFDGNVFLGDTWTWNGTTWSQKNPTNSPSPRGDASMALDATTGQLTLFGGMNSSSLLDETWIWNGSANTWTQLFPNASPPARADASMAFDATSGQLILFGGGSTKPIVTSISPNHGGENGGSQVLISGTGFSGATNVKFGVQSAMGFAISSDTQITALTPAGSPSIVDVTVITPGGTSATSPADHYTYLPQTTVTGVSPNQGPMSGGTSVTVTGTGFTGTTAVYFGFFPASSFTVISDTQITVTSPTSIFAGPVNVQVDSIGGLSAIAFGDEFTYLVPAQPPTVTGISPKKGSRNGGTSVTITGTGFTGATAVNFGNTPATTFTVNSATQITATSPAASPGTVDVKVTTAAGTSPVNSNDQFTYH